MQNELSCWRCGASLKGYHLPLERLAACQSCNAELHVCRMCILFNPNISDKCDEPKAEHPREQERANFCDYFKPNPHANVTRDMTKIRAAKNALDDLFGRQGDGSPSDNPRSALDDFFDSGAKKDK